MKGLFGLKTPKGLLQKLEREYAKLQANRIDEDTAWTFFVTADHLPDWLARTDPKSSGGDNINEFKRGHPVTRVCENLANGARHFRPNVRPKDKLNISVLGTGCEMTGYVEDGYYAEEPTLPVYLTSPEVVEFQKAGIRYARAKIEVPWLATHVLAFWRNDTKSDDHNRPTVGRTTPPPSFYAEKED
jgi:hypothetical protein